VNHRWLIARPFLLIAALGIVGGGLVAAVTGPLDLAYGSWLAAYLVLVVGVAQLGFGVGRALLPTDVDATRRTIPAELVTWNVGNVLVMGGTLVTAPWLVMVGSVGLLVALVLFLLAVRHSIHSGWALAFRALAVFLAGSVAVGIALSVARAA
jgi:hypothetical protein